MDKITKRKYYNEGDSVETVVETITDDNSDRIFELEKQLHEQYAVNNNSNSGTLISLLSTLLVAITGYGYVLYQYQIMECNTAIVNLAAIVAMAVMILLHCISIHLGAGQRMEQFITFAIRKKYYKSNKTSYEEIFPEYYHPFNKGLFSFVQGLYNIWSGATFLTVCGIVACSLIFVKDGCQCLIVCCGGIGIMCGVLYRVYKFKKYQKREHGYIKNLQGFLPDIKDDRKTFSCCDILCNALVLTFAIFFICLAIMTCYRDKFNENRQENVSHIKLENCEPIKVEIIN